jgi:hypothetical protein
MLLSTPKVAIVLFLLFQKLQSNMSRSTGSSLLAYLIFISLLLLHDAASDTALINEEATISSLENPTENTTVSSTSATNSDNVPEADVPVPPNRK